MEAGEVFGLGVLAAGVGALLYRRFPRRAVEVTDLPRELLAHVFGFLPSSSVLPVLLTCKRFFTVLNQGDLWRKCCQQQFPACSAVNFSSAAAWKACYRGQRQLHRFWTRGEYVSYRIDAHESSVNCLELSSDALLFSGSADTTIKLWNLAQPATLRQSPMLTISTGFGVRSIACSGALVVAGSGCRGTLRLWDVSHAPRAHVDGGLSLGSWQEHSEGVRGVWLRHPLLLSGSGDGLCKVWDVRCRRSAATLPADSDVHSLAFDGAYRMFAGGARGNVSWFDLRMMSAVALLRSGGSWISAMALRDGVLWTGNFQGTLCRFNLSAAEHGLPEVPHEDEQGPSASYPFLRLDRAPQPLMPQLPLPVSGLPEHSPQLRVQGCGYVRSLHLSPARLVAVGWGGEIEVRSPLQQGRRLCSLKYNNLLYCSSATEDTLISGSMDSTIQVWDFSRGTVPLATDLD